MHHLVGTAEIAVMLRVSRQRVHQLTSLPTFPAPVVILTGATVWERAAVEAWIEQRAREQPTTPDHQRDTDESD